MTLTLHDESDHDHEDGHEEVVDDRTLTAQRWYQWHAPYDALDSRQTDRLEVVQELLTHALDQAAAGRQRALSICSGQSRDLLPILIRHPRGSDFETRMVELDPLNASFLDGALGSTGLVDVEVVVADAGLTDAYLDFAPVDLVLLGGVFANVSLGDASRTVDTLPALCRPGASVVWTTYDRGLADADEVVSLLETTGFERIDLRRADDFVVAEHRYAGAGAPLVPGRRFFSFA